MLFTLARQDPPLSPVVALWATGEFAQKSQETSTAQDDLELDEFISSAAVGAQRLLVTINEAGTTTTS